MTTHNPCPADILAVLDSDGEIAMTRSQLRRLITWEAEQIGLTFDQTQAAAHAGTLARTLLGCDIDLLLRVLESGADIGAVEECRP